MSEQWRGGREGSKGRERRGGGGGEEEGGRLRGWGRGRKGVGEEGGKERGGRVMGRQAAEVGEEPVGQYTFV